MIKRQLLYWCLAVCFSSYALGQLSDDYRPITLSGQIPSEMLRSVKTQTKKELKTNNESFTQNEGKAYFALSNYQLQQTFISGMVYFNDDFSTYLNKIADRLLADDPQLRASIRIYATRLSIPNASAWRNGVIFFNVPLLSYLESEAQLAFVLAHEITHYQRKHSLKSYKKKIELESSLFSSSEDLTKQFELVQYSRNHELEADMEAFNMILKTDYAPMEALEALKLLKELNENDAKVNFDLDMNKVFQLADTSFDFGINCDINRFFQPGEKEETDEGQDSLSTHPNINKRIGVILEKVYTASDPKEGKEFIDSEERFNKIRDMAYFEQLQNYYNRGAFLNSLYGSLRISKYYPENLYLQELSAQSMFWLTKYIVEYKRNDVIPKTNNLTGSYAMFACYFNEITMKKMKEFSQLFLEDRLAKFPQSGEILINLAKIYSVNGSEEEALKTFEQYVENFPDSDHANYARTKIKDLKEEK